MHMRRLTSQKPNLAKILNASASRCFRYFLSSYLSMKVGGPVGTSPGSVRLGSPLLYVSLVVGREVSSAAAGAMVLSGYCLCESPEGVRGVNDMT